MVASDLTITATAIKNDRRSVCGKSVSIPASVVQTLDTDSGGNG